MPLSCGQARPLHTMNPPGPQVTPNLWCRSYICVIGKVENSSRSGDFWLGEGRRPSGLAPFLEQDMAVAGRLMVG